MAPSQIAKKIVEVPEVYDRSDASTGTLLREAGIMHTPPLNAADVEQVLREQPSLASKWFARAKDQRLARGWILDCRGDEFHLQNVETGRIATFPDRITACAAFIIGYVSRILEVQAKYPSRDRKP